MQLKKRNATKDGMIDIKKEMLGSALTPHKLRASSSQKLNININSSFYLIYLCFQLVLCICVRYRLIDICHYAIQCVSVEIKQENE